MLDPIQLVGCVHSFFDMTWNFKFQISNITMFTHLVIPFVRHIPTLYSVAGVCEVLYAHWTLGSSILYSVFFHQHWLINSFIHLYDVDWFSKYYSNNITSTTHTFSNNAQRILKRCVLSALRSQVCVSVCVCERERERERDVDEYMFVSTLLCTCVN